MPVLLIERHDPDRDPATWTERYEIPADDTLSVLQAIRHANQRLDPGLAYRNTDCRRGVCGLCSMLVDDRRQLACMIPFRDGTRVAPPPGRAVLRDLVFDLDW